MSIGAEESNEQPKETSGFNPKFALPSAEFLAAHGIGSTQNIDDETLNQVRSLVSDYLGIPKGEVTIEQLLGYKVLEGMALISGDFEIGYKETPEERRVEYVIMSGRRDDYAQFSSAFYTAARVGIKLNDQSYPENPEKWNFQNAIELQDFVRRIEVYWNFNEEFQKFEGEILGYLLHYFDDDRQIMAKFGLFYYLLFNRTFPVGHDRREEVLEGLGIPPQGVGGFDIFDDVSVKNFLGDKKGRLEQAKTIATCFTYFNSRAYLV